MLVKPTHAAEKITAIDAALRIEALARAIIRLESLEPPLASVSPLAQTSLDTEGRRAFALTVDSVREMKRRFERERDEMMSLLEIQHALLTTPETREESHDEPPANK